MKRFLAIVLTFMMIFSLVACGNGDSQSSSQQREENAGSSQSEQQGLDVDKRIFDVKITLPAEFVGEDATQESLEEGIAENDEIKSVVLNEDGSATYTMTKAAHKEMLSGIATEIENGLQDMIDDEDYTFTKIDHNDDFTSFTVETEAEELGLAESISTLLFYTYGGMYAAFSGEEVENIHIEFVNAKTGQVIDTADSKDLGSN